MGMKYSSGFDLNGLKTSLYTKSRQVNRAMQETTKEGAHQIMEKSKANAPVDTHNLEEAHHINAVFTRSDNVRYTIEVSGRGAGSENPRDVDNYALQVHENYENMGNGGHPRPGSKTAAKKMNNPDVGSKFLEKAITSERPAVINAMKQAVREAIKGKK